MISMSQGMQKESHTQRVYWLREILPKAMQARMEAEGADPEMCRAALDSREARAFVEAKMRKEVGFARPLPVDHPLMKRHAKPGLVAVRRFGDKRRALFHQRSQLALYWIDPVCYVIDKAAGAIREVFVPNEKERRFFDPPDPSARFPRAIERISIAAIMVAQQMSPENQNAMDAEPEPVASVIRLVKREEYRLTSRMPRWLTDSDGCTVLVICQDGESQYEQACHAIEWFAATTGIRALSKAYVDPSISAQIGTLLGEVLECEPIPLPECPPIAWEGDWKKLPPGAQRWWDRFMARPAAGEGDHILLLVTPQTARTFLEIVNGAPNAQWRTRVLASDAGSALRLRWRNPFVPHVHVSRF